MAVEINPATHFQKKSPYVLRKQWMDAEIHVGFPFAEGSVQNLFTEAEHLQAGQIKRDDPDTYHVYVQSLREMRAQKNSSSVQWNFRRSNWLISMMRLIQRKFYPDVPVINHLQIMYGAYPWKNRLGLIRLSSDNKTSMIQVNPLLQSSTIPLSVPIVTLAHEFTHYSHGFGSPLPRLYSHPHLVKNVHIVDREIQRRGLGHLTTDCDEYLDDHWYKNYPEITHIYRTRRKQENQALRRATVDRRV